MGFQDVEFPTSRVTFSTTFLKSVVDVTALGSPHVLKLLLGVSESMLPVKLFRSKKPLFVPVDHHGDHRTVTKLIYT